MQSGKKIGVLGATGRAGRHVVDVLNERGYDVVAMSRASGVDVFTGVGLVEALTGVECIIDVTSAPSPDGETATTFFTTAARNLNAAAARAGVKRLVVISIIGVDRFKEGYAAATYKHEQEALAGSVPVRILRAAQFHEFVGQLIDWGRQGDVSYLRAMRAQPVAARAVAEALVDLATAPETGNAAPIPEIAGPREEDLVELAKLLVARRGEQLRIEAVRDPNDPDRALYDAGALLPGLHARLAGPTFAEWLDAAIPQAAARR